MRILRACLVRLGAALRTKSRERQLADELNSHLELAIDENMRKGMTAAEARQRASLELGGLAATTEHCREERGIPSLESAARDIRFSLRALLKSPAFTCATVLTLALAIGANVAIFAVVHRVLLNPLEYPESDALIDLDHGSRVLNLPSGMGMTQGLYYHYAERARTLDGIALYGTKDLTLTGDGEPERIRVAQTTASLVSVLRVSAELGQWFTANDDRPGSPLVAVLSHSLWERRYKSDPNAVGRTLMLGGRPTTVVGIMPSSYAFPDSRIDIWVPMQTTRSLGFGLWSNGGVARLRAGITLDEARTEMNNLIPDLDQAFPGDPFAMGNGTQIKLFSTARTLKDATVGSVARALWILFASVGLVLLVACANVANLFLVRSEARQREVTIRRALGANRVAVARYYLTESILLSTCGGIIGVALAAAAVRLLVAYGPASLPRLAELSLDATVVAFAACISMLVALAFGAIPLWQSPATALLHSDRSTRVARSHHASHFLMAGQVALALVLLVASILMVRSFQKLRLLDPGFDATSSVTFRIGLSEREYPTRTAALTAHRSLLNRLSALPAVTAVSATTCLPLAGACSGTTIRVQGRTYNPTTIPPFAYLRAVASSYFETIGMRLIRGQTLNKDEIERGEPVVVVNEAFAERFFGDADPLGHRIASNLPPAKLGEQPALAWLTIIGVVANSPARALGEPSVPQVFMPMSIAGGPDLPTLVGPNIAAMSYVVRSTSPLTLQPYLRQAVDSVDATLAIAQVDSLQASLDRASGQMAFTMVLLLIAAVVALLLGVIGVYGVMSYGISLRSGEIGLRIALGMRPAHVAAMIVRQGASVTAAGIIVGLTGAFGGSRLLESLLYGVSSRDPGVFAGTAVLLLCVSLLACWLPARRAARLDPNVALRAE